MARRHKEDLGTAQIPRACYLPHLPNPMVNGMVGQEAPQFPRDPGGSQDIDDKGRLGRTGVRPFDVAGEAIQIGRLHGIFGIKISGLRGGGNDDQHPCTKRTRPGGQGSTNAASRIHAHGSELYPRFGDDASGDLLA